MATRYNVVIGVRSPNPLSFGLLKEGLPSKNFHIKAKSSPAGPTAGYLTEDPKYSKTPISFSQQHNHYIDAAKKRGSSRRPDHKSHQEKRVNKKQTVNFIRWG
ncbi:anthrax toxin-like adenylyl cyclase domain-containing protein [Ewingella americana]